MPEKKDFSFTLINGREMGKIREIERICKTTIAQHPIPASKEMLHAKADSVLKEAETCLKERNISEIRLFLTEKMAETGMDSFELAAALLQMQLGNTDMIADELIQDTVREYGRRNPRGNRTERRGHGGSSRGGFKDFKGAKDILTDLTEKRPQTSGFHVQAGTPRTYQEFVSATAVQKQSMKIQTPEI